MTDLDYWTAQGMLVYGGGFVQALARAAQAADDENLSRLKLAFPDLWSRYLSMGLMLKAKANAEEAP